MIDLSVSPYGHLHVSLEIPSTWGIAVPRPDDVVLGPYVLRDRRLFRRDHRTMQWETPWCPCVKAVPEFMPVDENHIGVRFASGSRWSVALDGVVQDTAVEAYSDPNRDGLGWVIRYHPDSLPIVDPSYNGGPREPNFELLACPMDRHSLNHVEIVPGIVRFFYGYPQRFRALLEVEAAYAR